jgi:hypothetical protein
VNDAYPFARTRNFPASVRVLLTFSARFLLRSKAAFHFLARGFEDE